jgi:hypothetical protein
VSRLASARRLLSGIACVSAMALVLARTRGQGAPNGAWVGGIAAFTFVVSILVLIEVSRREYAENKRAAAERERQQLALLQLQIELAKRARDAPGRDQDPSP